MLTGLFLALNPNLTAPIPESQLNCKRFDVYLTSLLFETQSTHQSILTDLFRGLPQSLQTNAGIVILNLFTTTFTLVDKVRDYGIYTQGLAAACYEYKTEVANYSSDTQLNTYTRIRIKVRRPICEWLMH
jgi:hypothetical protein